MSDKAVYYAFVSIDNFNQNDFGINAWYFKSRDYAVKNMLDYLRQIKLNIANNSMTSLIHDSYSPTISDFNVDCTNEEAYYNYQTRQGDNVFVFTGTVLEIECEKDELYSNVFLTAINNETGTAEFTAIPYNNHKKTMDVKIHCEPKIKNASAQDKIISLAVDEFFTMLIDSYKINFDTKHSTRTQGYIVTDRHGFCIKDENQLIRTKILMAHPLDENVI